MLEFDIKNYKIGFSFSFFSLLALVLCCEQWYITVFTLIACVIHEIGHLISMSIFGVKSSAILFYCGGIRIKYSNALLPFKYQLIVLLSGVFANFLIAVFAYAFNFRFVFLINLLIGIYNLLPFKYFDGGQVLNIIKENQKNAVVWCLLDSLRFVFSLSLLTICFILFYNGRVNLSMIITAVYIIIGEFICV